MRHTGEGRGLGMVLALAHLPCGGARRPQSTAQLGGRVEAFRWRDAILSDCLPESEMCDSGRFFLTAIQHHGISLMMVWSWAVAFI